MNRPFFPKILPGLTQVVALGAASVKATNAFGSQTYGIFINSTGACHFEIGTNPVASKTTSPLLSANVDGLFIGVRPGEVIAFIQDGAATGNASVTELTW